MKLAIATLLAVSLALAGCTADDDPSESGDKGSSNTGGGGSEVHGTVEVTNNTSSPTPATPTTNATAPAANNTTSG